MERLQTKRTVTRVELQKLSDELMQLRTADALELHQEDRIAEMKEELEALAKEMKQLDALIEPHVCDEDLAEEYGGVRKNQGLITRLERLHQPDLNACSERALPTPIAQRPYQFQADVTGARRMLCAYFKTIKDAYNLECDQLLRYGYTISRKAISPTDIEKQNVTLALQIFAESGPNAIRVVGGKHKLNHYGETA
ncbi:hypothetical protein HPB50_021870 [Hyalomma asiaticum]|uniref:Uncharacterized protein n=1 Tax=Hyalomma asiaticum TaxID=266040 RepID=A0ACB7SYY9_HYAAI|nr:hypothetical protein HPB50_021870 [Hyalomma asiaticum]